MRQCEVDDAGTDDVVERFVREMHKLEGRLNFVGYGMLCNQWMLDWGLGWNERECRRLIDEYQTEQLPAPCNGVNYQFANYRANLHPRTR